MKKRTLGNSNESFLLSSSLISGRNIARIARQLGVDYVEAVVGVLLLERQSNCYYENGDFLPNLV
jgi:hypothetical protein